MPRSSNKRTARLAGMSKQQLEREVEKLEFTVKSRGRRIGACYHTIQMLMQDNPHVTTVTLEDLRTQLTQARQQMSALMQARAGGVAPTNTQKHDCVVCFEEFNQDECRPVALSCGHILCESCCLKQQERTAKCPSCRKEFASFLPLFL